MTDSNAQSAASTDLIHLVPTGNQVSGGFETMHSLAREDRVCVQGLLSSPYLGVLDTDLLSWLPEITSLPAFLKPMHFGPPPAQNPGLRVSSFPTEQSPIRQNPSHSSPQFSTRVFLNLGNIPRSAELQPSEDRAPPPEPLGVPEGETLDAQEEP